VLRVLAFLLELRDAVPEVRLQLVRALVLGQERHHLAQRLEFLLVALRLPEALLRFLVLRGEVGGHRPNYRQPPAAPPTVKARHGFDITSSAPVVAPQPGPRLRGAPNRSRPAPAPRARRGRPTRSRAVRRRAGHPRACACAGRPRRAAPAARGRRAA